MAHLNRIKQLEKVVEEHKAALDEVEGENAELRAELAKSVDPAEAEAENATLREMLEEREKQVLAMSRRLSEALADDHDKQERRTSGGFPMATGSVPGARRDSFLDRFGLTSRTLASGA